MTAVQPHSDAWHDLLTTRYVCEVCLTRYFTPRRRCPACNRFGHIRPLVSLLMTIARDDEDLRRIISQGQMIGDERDEFSI
jgi:hypothetical protein